MYIGVEDGTKAHKLYDPQHEKIYVSRDVYSKKRRSGIGVALAITSKFLQSSLLWKKMET